MNYFGCLCMAGFTLSVVHASLNTRGTFYRINSEKETDVEREVISSFYHNCAQIEGCQIIKQDSNTKPQSSNEDSERWIQTNNEVAQNQGT